eukprot:2506867-Pyramimonas_sp.AAC.1
MFICTYQRQCEYTDCLHVSSEEGFTYHGVGPCGEVIEEIQQVLLQKHVLPNLGLEVLHLTGAGKLPVQQEIAGLQFVRKTRRWSRGQTFCSGSSLYSAYQCHMVCRIVERYRGDNDLVRFHEKNISERSCMLKCYLEEVRLLCELVDRVSTVRQDALVAVNKGDARRAARGA